MERLSLLALLKVCRDLALPSIPLQIGRVDFDAQIDWFENSVKQLNDQLGEATAKDILAKSLFATVFGSNDDVNNYLLSYVPVNKVNITDKLKFVLLNKTAEQIARIYNLGACLIVVSNIGPIGCIPSQLVRQRSVNGECSEYVNGLASDFNEGLLGVLKQLNQDLLGIKVVYADVYTSVLEYVQNPTKYGKCL
ncbi:hypothetical protein L7F22_065144 [Adiantum nelumboides]|nr:hypothetical protein [Adiantum nelumboides]